MKNSRKGHATSRGTEPKRKPPRTKFPRQSFSHSFQWWPVSRPGGTPQEISRGQVRASGRSPRNHPEVAPCPSGASKKKAGAFPTRGRCCGPGVGWPPFGKPGAIDETPRGRRHEKLLRCPAGAWPFLCVNRGPRPLARSCPRLISCGVPPGRSACVVYAGPDRKPLERLSGCRSPNTRLKPGANEMGEARIAKRLERGRSSPAACSSRETRLSFSPRPRRFTRRDRGPGALLGERGVAALRSSRPKIAVRCSRRDL